MLADEESKNCFAAVVNYKLTGKISYLNSAYGDIAALYSLIGDARFAVDVGAYNGDTVREMKTYFESLSRIIGIEPDKKNFKRLQKYCESCEGVKPEIINAAAGGKLGEGIFAESGNRNSTIAATASFEHRDASVPIITLDSLDISPDYIKYDVEGAEHEALTGSAETIGRSRPTLLISLYHKSSDIFELVFLAAKLKPKSKLYVRRKRCLPAWEIDLIVK